MSKPNCSACPLAVDCKPNTPVFPQQRPKSRLAIIGDMPGYAEVKDRKPFTGKLGHIVKTACRRAEINPWGIQLGFAVSCMQTTKMRKKELLKAYTACAPRLAGELRSARSLTTVVAIGENSFRQLTGLTGVQNWAGTPLPGVGPYSHLTIFASPWPSYKHIVLFEATLGRAKLFAEGLLPEWEWAPIHTSVSEGTLAALERIAESGDVLGFDIEGDSMDPITSKITCMSLSSTTESVSIPWDGYDSKRHGVCPPIERFPLGMIIALKFRQILADPTIAKVMHNGSHDQLGTKYKGITLRGLMCDTLMAHHVLYSEMSHALSYVGAQYFHGPRWKTIFGETTDAKGAAKYVERDPLVLRDYNAKDALITAKLWQILLSELEDFPRGMEIYQNYMDCDEVATRMRESGVLIDTDALEAHREPRQKIIDESLEKLKTLTAHIYVPGTNMKGKTDLGHFNFKSTKQLSTLFFDLLKVTPSSYSPTTGEPSVDETFLIKVLAGHNQLAAAISRVLLEYRKAGKVISTYIDGLEIQTDGKVRPTYKVYGTVTGRWSSSNPNAQNQPKDMRNSWLPSRGWVLAADYSALELRIMALLAGDLPLLEDFWNDMDSHSVTAMRCFGLATIEEVGKYTHRQVAKMVAYGFNYNASSDVTTVWEGMIKDFPKLTIKQVQFFRQVWFEIHPSILRWQSATLTKANRLGYVEEPSSGRREYFRDGLVDPNKALNFPVQSMAGRLMNEAMIALDVAIDWSAESIMAQVHDAAYLDVSNPHRGAELLQTHMAQEITLNGYTLAFPVDVEIGRNMRDLKPWDAYLAVSAEIGVDEWFLKSNKDGLLP